MRQRILAWMEELDLCDAWRHRNQSEQRFTFHRANQASRIDYWLISDHLLDSCNDINIHPMALSDHSMITLSIGEQAPSRGPGLWCFDPRLLNDRDYTQMITETLTPVIAEPDLKEPIQNWEWIKFVIRRKSMEYERGARSKARQEEKTLTKQLESLRERRDAWDPEVDKEEVSSVKRQLAELELERAQKIIFRGRANWARFGERTSQYFLNLEKRKSKADLQIGDRRQESTNQVAGNLGI